MRENGATVVLRSEIIAKNFFGYLKQNGITQQQYAEDNHLDRSLVSKWKNGASCMTTEQIYQAAKYLKITVNDLFYDAEEKGKMLILADESYSPISANRIMTVKRYDLGWNKRFGVAEFCALLLLAATALSWLAFWKIPYISMLLLLVLIPLLKSVYKGEFENEQSYSIDYLDDIFYSRTTESTVSRFYPMLWVVCFGTVILGIPDLCMRLYDESLLLSIVVAVHLFITVITAVLILLPIFSCRQAAKERLRDDEVNGFSESFCAFMAVVLLNCFSGTAYIFVYQDKNWLLITQAICAISAYVAYRFLYREYGRYTLVYEKYGQGVRSLYPSLMEKKQATDDKR